MSLYNGQNFVSWLPNVDGDLAGYKVYTGSTMTGTTGGIYDLLKTVTTTSVSRVVASLQNGQTWFHAVTAYDSAGNESTFSAEVSRIPTGTVLNLLRRIA